MGVYTDWCNNIVAFENDLLMLLWGILIRVLDVSKQWTCLMRVHGLTLIACFTKTSQTPLKHSIIKNKMTEKKVYQKTSIICVL